MFTTMGHSNYISTARRNRKVRDDHRVKEMEIRIGKMME